MLAVFAVIAFRPIVTLLTSPYGLDEAPEILGNFAPDLILAVLMAGLVLFAERILTTHYTLTRQFSRDRFTGGPPRTDAVPEGPQNLVVYGGYAPFVGSGYRIGGWSFPVNLERTHEELGVSHAALPFGTRDLLKFVERRLDRLQIPGLNHYEVLFADGRHLRGTAALLAGAAQPKRRIPPASIVPLDDLPAVGTRSYLCINVTDWSGEIVLSAYLRCKRGQSNLFLEASYFLLAPLRRSFYKIDEIDPQLRLGKVLGLLVQSLAASVFVLCLAGLRLVAAALAPVGRWSERRRIRREIQRNPRFNFGAVTSIRELGMENYFRVYFQELDKERHLKTIEQCTIDAIVEFLADHNIDTSDIRERRSAILNNGVIVAGGDLNAENLAVGKSAKATMSGLGAKVARRRKPAEARS
jgi:hypothetical protein